MAEQKAHKDQEQLCGEYYLIKYDEGVMTDVLLKRHDTRSKKCCYAWHMLLSSLYGLKLALYCICDIHKIKFSHFKLIHAC